MQAEERIKELIIAKYGNVSYLASGHEMGF